MIELTESRKRSIAKSISYRIICVISLLIITWILTGDIYKATYITLIFQTLQTFLYYLHERAWANYSPINV
jgi:uncharacterized membrane protein